jgi:hypothetical protein
VTRRSLAAALVLLAAVTATAGAQLVPVTRCNAALPCSIPFGLRPADAAAWTPGAKVGQGNTAVSASSGVDQGLKPKLDMRPVPQDPSEFAARIYVKNNPLPKTPGPTPPPTPAPTPTP